MSTTAEYVQKASASQRSASAALEGLAFDDADIVRKLRNIDSPCYIVRHGSRTGVTHIPGMAPDENSGLSLLTVLPVVNPSQLGSSSFLRDHRVQYAYMAGAMAKGIASEEMIIALGKKGFLGSFGAGGLSLDRIEQAILHIQREIPGKPYAFNLLHSPKEAAKEKGTVDLYLKHGVTTVEASSYMQMNPFIAHYRLAGLSQRPDGSICIGNRVIIKLSRVELAAQFMQPTPATLIGQLLQEGSISALQARLAEHVPMADDITVEADSGGHTDNRPLISLLPAMLKLRDTVRSERAYSSPVRIGAAGGIATPQSVLAAYMMGADYVVTGSINQACVESGTSTIVKALLAQVGMTDVAMAPESDMFEQGFKVQAVKQGSMFPMRAQKLYDTYQKFESIDAIPAHLRETLERQIFNDSLDNIWLKTAQHFATRNPSELKRAENPKVKMALVFRWYLGQSSRWAIDGNPERRLDYQIWCGPSMGAFNLWVQDTFLQSPANRRVADVAQLLMDEAAYLYRLQSLKMLGLYDVLLDGAGERQDA